MAERIYVMNEKGEIHPLAEEPFDTEDLLQRLVADHPELLDGEQMRPGDPRRWILITREKSIPDAVDADAFWERVATNLAARRLRLLFVADRIPDELARVVEFLNEQTKDNIEVLAVEIKQFRGASLTTLVPQVIGRTVLRLRFATLRTNGKGIVNIYNRNQRRLKIEGIDGRCDRSRHRVVPGDSPERT